MTKTSKYTRRLVQKLICLLVLVSLVSSTHQVAHAEDSKKSAKTKSNNSSPKRCKANISKATAQHSDTSPSSSGDASDPIPLGECEGDCDTDTDCEEALNCRKNGYGTVPGCKRCASGGMSYCYARPDNSDGRPYLWIVDKKVGGDDKIPLGECEGDCDTDTDCEEALNCRLREKGDDDTVPGCEGKASCKREYCYARPAASSDGLPYLWIVDKKVEGGENISLGECEGDCDTDTDCEEALNCRSREKGDDDTVPGCEGKASGKKEYCYARPNKSDGLPYLWIVDKKVEGDENISLGECEGDCDTNIDCEGALNCRFREKGDDDTVPGCEGKASGKKDYCYARPDNSSDGLPYLWIVYKKAEGGEEISLGKCEGNCDTNTDCEGDLNCRQREEGDDDTVPGCEGKASRKSDYCYARPAANSDDLPYLWIFKEKDMFGACEGDCKNNNNKCEEDLRCFKRDEGADDTVPGCVGIASGTKDYCYARPAANSDDLPYLWIFKEKKIFGECEGDCKNNNNKCEGDLKCFQRKKGDGDLVPGCVGIATGTKDYCYVDMF